MMTMTCDAAEPSLARQADHGDPDGPRARAVATHLAECAACRKVLADQRAVAALLMARPPDLPSAAFAKSLAAQLDSVGRWLRVADWRVWTLRLSPVLGLLIVAAVLSSIHRVQAPTPTPLQWLGASDRPSPAAVLWQFDVPADVMVNMMLTGVPPQEAVRDAPR